MQGVIHRIVTASELCGREIAFPTIRVLKAAQPFALSLGGGLVVISDGLIRTLGTESEFAFVIAHELGHELLHHAGDDRGLETEIEADSRGLACIALAGYHPFAAIRAVEIISAAAHTSDAASEKAVQERLIKLRAAIEKSGWRPPGTISRRSYDLVRKHLGP